ncbi:MAG: cytochrome-c oxidase [Marinilabiliales bacterium]|jgi:cytochrome c oxidase subunit 4|nr:MAG: cytochrome-c oxidase [Marinilabiliales bacterium]
MDDKNKKHITSYQTYGIVLVGLLILTFISVGVTWIELGPLTVTVALLVASVKVFIVLTYFMHLKYDSLFIKLMVAGIFILFAVIIVITFLDYWFR